MIEGILFDLDGLMFDSEPHSLASWDARLQERGVRLYQPTIDRILGLRIDETAEMLIVRYNLPDAVEAFATAKTDYQIAHLDGRVPPMPGLFELIDEVDQLGLKKAIATSGLARYAAAVLRVNGLSDRFDSVVAGDQVTRGKPAPDIFLAAARAIDVEPQHALVLEDSPAGVEAAKTAGMICAAVPNDRISRGDVSKADYVLSSLHEVRDLLLPMW